MSISFLDAVTIQKTHRKYNPTIATWPLQLRPFIDKSLEIISYFLHATKALTDNIKDNNKIVHITCKKNYLS